MTALLQFHWPELLLTAVACVLFLLGASKSPTVRRFVPMLATGALLAVFGGILWFGQEVNAAQKFEHFAHFSSYIKLLSSAVGILFVLLSWPTNEGFTGNVALDVGTEVGEFFALMLLAIAGIFLAAGADDIILLFLGIELASIPTYIMVSISRPLPVAQEAGVKYFFLGAMAAALMLFGFSYLYGTTGSTSLTEIRQRIQPLGAKVKLEFAPDGKTAVKVIAQSQRGADAGRTLMSVDAAKNTILLQGEDGADTTYAVLPAAAVSLDGAATTLGVLPAGTGLTSWQLLAVVVLLMGFAFKLAAVPLHSYAGDVYTGAATPVTALLAFVPKATGIVAVIKVLTVAAGPNWDSSEVVVKLLWVIAVLTMTFGNVLGMLQQNIKRIFAYSSVAHSGYMLVAVTVMMAGHGVPGRYDGESLQTVQSQAITAILFYLCAYGIMNAGAFGVLMMLPGRTDTHGRHDADGRPLPTASSAETLSDIAGQGRRHIALGLGMAVCCFSLTGLPLTVGFLGKVLLIQPAFAILKQPGNPFGSWMAWLVALMMINAAISASYYLKIVRYLFLQSEQGDSAVPVPYSYPKPLFFSWPVALAVILSVGGTIFYGTVLPGTAQITSGATKAAQAIGESAKAAPAPVVAAPLGTRANAR